MTNAAMTGASADATSAPRPTDFAARLRAMYTVVAVHDSNRAIREECVASTSRGGGAPATYVIATRASEAWLRRVGVLLAAASLCGNSYDVDRAVNTTETVVEHWLTGDAITGKVGPNAGRLRWRDVDATGSHFRAILDSADRGHACALFLEEDVEFWISPPQLLGMVESLSRLAAVHYAMLGGCWRVHAADDWRRVGGPLPAGSRLLLSPARSTAATRCGHAYTVSASGARLLLSLAASRPMVETFSHFVNALHAQDGRLVGAFVEPPVACQVRGPVAGSRQCFRACPSAAAQRGPVRILPALADEAGVSGCEAAAPLLEHRSSAREPARDEL